MAISVTANNWVLQSRLKLSRRSEACSEQKNSHWPTILNDTGAKTQLPTFAQSPECRARNRNWWWLEQLCGLGVTKFTRAAEEWSISAFSKNPNFSPKRNHHGNACSVSKHCRQQVSALYAHTENMTRGVNDKDSYMFGLLQTECTEQCIFISIFKMQFD